MEDVLLLIEVSAIVRSEIGGKQEQSLGIFKYPIVGANGECCLVNRLVLQDFTLKKMISCIPHPLFFISPTISSKSGCGIQKAERKSFRTYAEFLSSENIFDKKLTPNHEQTQFKIVLKVLDVPKEIVPVVE